MIDLRIIPDELVVAADLKIITEREAIGLTLAMGDAIPPELEPALEAFLLWALHSPSSRIH